MIGPRGLHERRARAFVWATYVTMLGAVIWSWLNATINIPLTEDWLLVPGLTGHDPHFWRSLWEQNSEHRAPLPRLVLTVVLRLAHGNVRAGMAWNVATIAAGAAALLVAIRVARGGVTRFGDALIPLLLLHLGNWENLFWAWQATQVMPTVFVVLLIALGLVDPALANWRSRFVASGLTVALPLCGGNGLAVAPFALGWLWAAGAGQSGRARLGLWGAGGVTGLLGLAYVAGFQRPDWIPANPGLGPSLQAAAQFVALGWGPVARSAWLFAVPAAALVVGLGLWAALSGLRSTSPPGRRRMVLLIWWTVALGTFALAMGWGRAGAIEIYKLWPTRYALFAAPLLLVAYCQWSLARGPRARWFPAGLTVSVGLLAPLNAVHGLEWAGFYRTGAERVLADLKAHGAARTIASKHRVFLHHSMDPTDLANAMVMLKDASMWPWPLLSDAAETVRPKGDDGAAALRLKSVEFRYRNPLARQVELVWGVDGWWPMPSSVRPAATKLVDGVMRTSLEASPDGWFSVRVQVPETGLVESGFAPVDSATGVASWEPNTPFRADTVTMVQDSAAVSDSPAVIPNPLVGMTVRYQAPFASNVALVWGVDGWRPVTEAVREGEAAIRDRVLETMMRRTGDEFLAQIRAPVGAKLDYGFRSLSRRGILDFVSPQWEARTDRPVFVAGGEVRVIGHVDVLNEVREVRARWRYLATAIVGLALGWVALIWLPRPGSDHSSQSQGG